MPETPKDGSPSSTALDGPVGDALGGRAVIGKVRVEIIDHDTRNRPRSPIAGARPLERFPVDRYIEVDFGQF